MRTTAPPIIHHPADMGEAVALNLVDRYQTDQLERLHASQSIATGIYGLGSHYPGIEFGDVPSVRVTGAYPDGSYRITLERAAGDDTPVEYEPAPNGEVPVQRWQVIHPHAMEEREARHLVYQYRAAQHQAPWPGHASGFFKRHPQATRPSDRVSGMLPGGYYVIESGGGWIGDGESTRLWSPPDVGRFDRLAHYYGPDLDDSPRGGDAA